MEITFLPTNTSEIHLHVEQLLLNTGRRTQTSRKARKSPRTWVGQKKKQRQKNRDGTCTSGRELWRRKGFHTLGSPFADRDCGWQRGEASEPRRRAQQQGCGGQSGEIPARRLGSAPSSTHQPERLVCSPAGAGGAGSRGPEGVSAPRLAGRESGKKSAAAKEARDFFLPLCFLVREERGFRAPPKQTPETGASRGYQRGCQRRAWDAKAAAAATKNPVCEHRSLSTPPVPGACAARHCQGPVIQGKLTRENARRASGWCNVTPASAAAGSPASVPLPPPGLSEPEPPNQLLL